MGEVTGQDHLKPSHTEVTQLPIVEEPKKWVNMHDSMAISSEIKVERAKEPGIVMGCLIYL